ncbi:endospore germination permease [Rossellomorea sp. GCM10028870]|uniref:endospore germination permease n=1 Tax=Rossellomorea sp. GCM10028870 TaxID=3273426 RepID=UPI00361222C0
MTFSRLQISFLFIIYISISNHVIILPHLLKVAKRDSWICVLIAYAFMLIWGLMIHITLKRIGNKKLYVWLKERVGKWLSLSIILLFMMLLLMTALISFNDFILTVNIYFLPRTPFIIVSFTFIALCLYGAKSGLKTIVYMCAVLLPIICFLGVFVALATSSEKTYSYLFPLLMNGLEPIVKGTLIVMGGCVDFLVLLLLQHKLKKSFSYKQFFIIITIAIALTIGPTTGLITNFGPYIASSFRFPAFEQWRLVSLGKTITHVDFLAIFQLIAGVSIKVALCIFLIGDLMETKSNITKNVLFLLTPLLLFGFTMLPISDITMEAFLDNFLYAGWFPFGFILSLLVFGISFLRIRREEG